MATLTLDTALTEWQMNQVIDALDSFLSRHYDYIDMQTFEYQIGNIRIEAEFTSFLNRIDIRHEERFFNGLNAEVFTDYLTLKSDTMVFQQRVQYLLDQFNQRRADAGRHYNSLCHAG